MRGICAVDTSDWCAGWVRTGMTEGRGLISAEESAAGLIGVMEVGNSRPDGVIQGQRGGVDSRPEGVIQGRRGHGGWIHACLGRTLIATAWTAAMLNRQVDTVQSPCSAGDGLEQCGSVRSADAWIGRMVVSGTDERKLVRLRLQAHPLVIESDTSVIAARG
eukprot:1179802-Prorocentrum_minimum.AAC.4